MLFIIVHPKLESLVFGELFYVNQDAGTVSFTANALNVDLTTGATFTTGSDTSFINGSRIDVGNLRLTGKHC